MSSVVDTALHSTFDVERTRRDFPLLSRSIRGRSLVYLDNAATTQKPERVISALQEYYRTKNANVHRGVHTLSEEATTAYEGARGAIRTYINAGSDREIIFVRGTTEAINLVASSYGRKNVGAGDEVIITGLEHHSNIVPWQLLCQEKKALLRVVQVEENGEIDVEAFKAVFSARTRLVAISHTSNALGTVNPVKEMVGLAHEHGVPVLVDGAQAMAHGRVDVRDLDCDFFAFSGHKMFGPTGIGVLYGKEKVLETMPPYQGGGDMIKSVSFTGTVFNDLPYRFEAGTPNIAGTVGLGESIRYLQSLDWDSVRLYEEDLLSYATGQLSSIPFMRLIGTAPRKSGVLSFVLDDVHPHDIGTILDRDGIAIRTGHHCAQPVMERFGVPATARASFAFYNTKAEVDRFVASVGRVRSTMGYA